MIKKTVKFICVLVVIITISGVCAAASAARAPGGSEDPVVTKSYVDMRIDQVAANIGNAPQAGADMDALKQAVLNELRTEAAAFAPVHAAAGQVILGGEGTEIVLRSGRAAGFCPGENGMVDATDGAEIYSGYDVPVNHLVLVPRDDGRGVVTQSEEAWFIIKGAYQIITP